MAEMVDAENWAAIPAGAYAAVYDDGKGACPAWARRRWPAVVGISVFANPDSELFDSENLNAPPWLVVRACQTRLRAGKWSVIYRGTDARSPSIEQCLTSAGVYWSDPAKWPAPGIYRWGVDWTGVPHLNPGDLATQYAGNLPDDTDRSLTFGSFPLLPGPAPAPDPTPIAMEDGMVVVIDTATEAVYMLWADGHLTHLSPAGVTGALGCTKQTAPQPVVAGFIGSLAGYQSNPAK